IVADNGSDMYITGTFDTRWNNDILNPAFSLLSASDFEVIQLGWTPPSGSAALSGVSASPNQVVGGSGATGTVTLTAAAPSGGAIVTLSSSAPSIASVPASIVVAAGATSASFTVTTAKVTKNAFATFSATYSGVTKSVSVTIKHR